MSATKKQPWFKFYPASWRGDPALSSCSMAARGLWIDLLCIMHQATVRGELTINDKQPSAKQIANLTGCPPNDCTALLIELEEAGVFSRRKNGIIYSRKMVNSENLSRKNEENGKLGASARYEKEKEIIDSLWRNVSHRGKRIEDREQSIDHKNDLIPLSEEHWKAFITHRIAIKKPLSLHAAELAIKNLVKYYHAGSDPGEVIEQSIMNGWQGIFEINNRGARHDKKPSGGKNGLLNAIIDDERRDRLGES